MSRRGLARFAAKRDANEPAIVQALEAQGFHVARVSGKGFPDLVVSKGGGFLRLVEIKNPKGKNRETDDQRKFREAYQGPAVVTLRSVDDALKFMLLAMEGDRALAIGHRVLAKQRVLDEAAGPIEDEQRDGFGSGGPASAVRLER